MGAVAIYDRTMRTAAEVVLACSAALFALGLAAVALRTLDERVLVGVAALLGACTVAAGAALAISLIRADGDWRVYAVALAALALLTAAQVAVVIMNRLRARDLRLVALTEQAFQQIDERIDGHAAQRAKQLEHTLASERARSQHALIDQERDLASARQTALAHAERASADELLAQVRTAQDQLESKVAAWSSDLTRAQDEQASRIEDHDRIQRSALSSQREQLDEHEKALRMMSQDQRSRAEELANEFSELVSKLDQRLHRELEVQEQHFRREIAQLSERLKAVSQSLRDDAYREELDARTRLASDIGGAERRVVASYEKSLERAADRIAETAERRFDEQIRESREDTAKRLADELQRTRDAYAHQIEEEIEERMQEVARNTTQRLQRQLDQVVRQAEGQTSTTEDRITFITQRLESAMEAAAGRVAAFESDLELELTTRLSEFERAVRHAQQSVERETG